VKGLLDVAFTNVAGMGVDKDEDALMSAQPSRPTSAQGKTRPSLCLLAEVCKRAAAKLRLEWPTSQAEEGTAKSLYDGRRLVP